MKSSQVSKFNLDPKGGLKECSLGPGLKDPNPQVTVKVRITQQTFFAKTIIHHFNICFLQILAQKFPTKSLKYIKDLYL